MERVKLTVEDLRDQMENDDSVNLILSTDPDLIEDEEVAVLWQRAIDAISELDSHIHSYG